MEQPVGESTLVALFRHHVWANRTLIDASAALPAEHPALTAPGAFGTVPHTLTHMIANEERYLSILTGQPVAQPLKRGEVLGFPELRRRAQASGEALIRVAPGIRLSDTRVQAFEGRETAVPLYIVLIQALNHGTEHRTNITTVMAQHGLAPPGVDGWAYMEEAGSLR